MFRRGRIFNNDESATGILLLRFFFKNYNMKSFYVYQEFILATKTAYYYKNRLLWGLGMSEINIFSFIKINSPLFDWFIIKYQVTWIIFEHSRF